MKSLLQLIIGTHKVCAIVWCYNFDIATPCNELFQCGDKWICLHWVCDFNMHCSTCKACKHCSISLQFLLVLFYDKWTKHIYFTAYEREWISNSSSWKFCHVLCTKFVKSHNAILSNKWIQSVKRTFSFNVLIFSIVCQGLEFCTKWSLLNHSDSKLFGLFHHLYISQVIAFRV